MAELTEVEYIKELVEDFDLKVTDQISTLIQVLEADED